MSAHDLLPDYLLTTAMSANYKLLADLRADQIETLTRALAEVRARLSQIQMLATVRDPTHEIATRGIAEIQAAAAQARVKL